MSTAPSSNSSANAAAQSASAGIVIDPALLTNSIMAALAPANSTGVPPTGTTGNPAPAPVAGTASAGNPVPATPLLRGVDISLAQAALTGIPEGAHLGPINPVLVGRMGRAGQSCDNCRSRKLGCRLFSTEVNTCKFCQRNSLLCVVTHVDKRRT